MAFAPGAWLRESVGVYFGNATATRDFRVQLRGNRSVLLWSLYLVVLIGFGMLMYSNTATDRQLSIVEAQRQLRLFYDEIMGLLGVMITVVAPALTATAVVAERQRQSLDLVFSAPVSPKYFLVGKMISSYRYTWMMLVLSLPVTSACVVLGGATWSDVLGAYVLLSLHGLIFTSIALLMSTLSQKPVAAVIWSYVAAMFYAGASSAIAAGVGGMRYVSGSMEMPFTVTLNPFVVSESSQTYTTLYGHQIPNWVFMAIVALMFSKLMLLGAASVLSGFGATDTKSLRVHGFVYLMLVMFGLGCVLTPIASMVGPVMATSGGPPSMPSAPTATHAFAVTFGWLLMPLAVVLPFLSCYGRDHERKFWPDGTFKVRNIFLGTPSGGLPYLLLLVVGSSVAFAGGFYYKLNAWPQGEYLAITFWSLALWFFGWSLGRWTSAGGSGVRTARTMQFAALVAVGALPVPFLTLLNQNFSETETTTVWDLYVMRPIMFGRDSTERAVFMGIVLLLLGILVTLFAERGAATRGVKLRTNE